MSNNNHTTAPLDDEPKKNNNSVRDVLILGIVFVIYAVIISIHIITRIKTHVVGYFGSGDLMGTFHLYWLWKKYMVYNWQTSFETGLTIHALGSYIYNTFSFAFRAQIYHFGNFIIFRMLETFMPSPAFYNAAVIISYGLNGFSFSLLALYLLKNKWTAAATGIIFSLSSPLFVSYVNGMNEVCWIFPVPLFFLFMIKMFEENEGGWKYAVGAACMAGLATYFYWFYGLMLAMYSVIILAYYFYKSLLDRSLFKKFLWLPLILIIYSILITPFMLPVANDRIALLRGEKMFHFHYQNGMDVKDLQNDVRVMGNRSASIMHVISPRGYQLNMAFIPYAVTVLFLVSLLFIRKIPGIWYLIAIISYILSLGPFLQRNATFIKPLVPNSLYLYLLEKTGIFTFFHWPFRFAVFTEAAMLIIAGYTIIETGKLLKRFSVFSKWKRLPETVLSVLVAGAVIFQLYSYRIVPVVISKMHIPQFYYKLSEESRPPDLIHLPFTSADLLRGERLTVKATHNICDYERIMFYRTIHKNKENFNRNLLKKDIMGDSFPNNSFLRHLAFKSHGKKDLSKVKNEDYRKLLKSGFKYVVVHEGLFPDRDRNRIRHSIYGYLYNLCGEPVDSGHDYFKLNSAQIDEFDFTGTEFYRETYLFKLPENTTEKKLNSQV